MPLHAEINYSDLAQKLTLDATNLRCLVRHAMTNHIFREPRPGYVAHTSSSRLLACDAQIAAWVGFFSEDLWLPIASTVDAMEKWPSSQEPTETGFQVANQTTENFFEIFAQRPESLKRYGTAMAANAASEGYHVRHIVDGYPWGESGEAVVVDVSLSRLQLTS